MSISTKKYLRSLLQREKYLTFEILPIQLSKLKDYQHINNEPVRPLDLAIRTKVKRKLIVQLLKKDAMTYKCNINQFVINEKIFRLYARECISHYYGNCCTDIREYLDINFLHSSAPDKYKDILLELLYKENLCQEYMNEVLYYHFDNYRSEYKKYINTHFIEYIKYQQGQYYREKVNNINKVEKDYFRDRIKFKEFETKCANIEKEYQQKVKYHEEFIEKATKTGEEYRTKLSDVLSIYCIKDIAQVIITYL